jgi:hypothetical protein
MAAVLYIFIFAFSGYGSENGPTTFLHRSAAKTVFVTERTVKNEVYISIHQIPDEATVVEDSLKHGVR